MKLTKNFKSIVKGDVPISVKKQHTDIVNLFLVNAFSSMQKSTAPIHPDETFWTSLSFTLNYKKDAVGFGGCGRSQPYFSIALFDCMPNDNKKSYLIIDNIHAYISNQCAMLLATVIRKYLQNNPVALMNPEINVNEYTRAQLTSPDGIVFKDVHQYIYHNLLASMCLF